MNTSEKVRAHYLIEKELAARIMAAPPEQRAQTTMDAYNELFDRVPWHSQLMISPQARARKEADKWMKYGDLVGPHSDVIDIAAGDAHFTRFLANKTAGCCVGIDVSTDLLNVKDLPDNLELLVMDAVCLDLPPDSFDLALSSQFVEHIHPDDVKLHLERVCRILRPRGAYAFDTPTRLTGPHDISRHFDKVATGFHLKEWTYTELTELLHRVGFRRVETQLIPWKAIRKFPRLRRLGSIPTAWLTPFESVAARIPHRAARRVFCKIFRVATIYITAYK